MSARPVPPLRVVINADDFGRDTDTVAATIDAFERGLLTSATIMANMPATDQAVEWARKHPQYSFGVHLVWVSDGAEWPLSPAETIPSLLRGDGQFRDSTTMRIRGLLRRVPASEIAAESRRQVTRLTSAGVVLSHADAHGHLHKFGSFLEALRNVLPELGIERLRTAQDLYLNPSRTSPTVWLGPHWRRAIRGSFRTTAHFYMPASDGAESWSSDLLPLLRRRGGTVEVGVHPGTEEAWRVAELRGLEDFVGRLGAEGVSLIDWRAI